MRSATMENEMKKMKLTDFDRAQIKDAKQHDAAMAKGRKIKMQKPKA